MICSRRVIIHELLLHQELRENKKIGVQQGYTIKAHSTVHVCILHMLGLHTDVARMAHPTLRVLRCNRSEHAMQQVANVFSILVIHG